MRNENKKRTLFVEGVVGRNVSSVYLQTALRLEELEEEGEQKRT